jgi:hypothetical protein
MVLMLSATGDGRGEVEVVVQVVVVVQVAVTLGFIFLSASGPTISYGGDAVDSLAVVQPLMCDVTDGNENGQRESEWKERDFMGRVFEGTWRLPLLPHACNLGATTDQAPLEWPIRQ